MKGLLVDENLPMPTALPTALPIVHSTHVEVQATDSRIWAFAAENDLVILTKDSDFSDRIQLSGPPPKVIHLRVGNMRRAVFLSWLFKRWPAIEEAAQEHKLVNVYLDHIEMMA